jgi:hypothetical protein
MHIRLNGWQRVGIVLSVIWAIGGGLWGNAIGIHQGDWAVEKLKFCYAHNTEWAPCDVAFHMDYSTAIAGHWYVAAIVGLVPIPLGWLIVYALIGLWRWIRRGFNT